MWTFEQWMRLLSVLASPAVAVISGWAFVAGCRILNGSRESQIEALGALGTTLKVIWNSEYAAKREAHMMELHKVGDTTSPTKIKQRELASTCERAFIAILAANGGIPASREEKAARALVREIRDMYSEIESPTPAPPSKPHTNSIDYDDLDPDLDEETMDHVYARFATDELDAQDSDDRPDYPDDGP